MNGSTTCWQISRSASACLIGVLFAAAHSGAGAFAQSPETLGEPTATYAEPFSLVAGLRELSDGRVLVADAIDESLYELAPDLSSGRRIGRNGGGPNEYRQPDALFPMRGDTTLMTDLGNGRLTVVAPDGSFVRTVPIAQDRGGNLAFVLPAAVDESGRVYFQERGADRFSDSASVVRWDRVSGRTDTVATVRLPELKTDRRGDGNQVATRVQPIPFSPRDGWTAGPDGSVVVVRASDYAVEWYRPDGSVVRGAANPWNPVPIRSADRREWLDDLATNGLSMRVENENGRIRTSLRRGGRDGRTPGAEDLEWPSSKPAFDAGGVGIAPDGTVWVRRYRPAGEPDVYDVFGADARRIGSIGLPAGRQLVGFGRRGVYLSRRDELDFRWLERYPLPSR